MFDASLRTVIDPPLNRLGHRLARQGLTPDVITVGGFALGLGCIPANALGAWGVSLALLAANRLADGLDGAVARATGPSDAGGFLDIVCDFLFYAGFVFGFLLGDMENRLPAAFLLFSFMGTGSSFLGFAIFAAKHGLTTERRGKKAFHYLGGLTEGGETILLFVLMLLFPGAFAPLAWVFGTACWVTTGWRLWHGYAVLRDHAANGAANGAAKAARSDAGPVNAG